MRQAISREPVTYNDLKICIAKALSIVLAKHYGCVASVKSTQIFRALRWDHNPAIYTQIPYVIQELHTVKDKKGRVWCLTAIEYANSSTRSYRFVFTRQ